MRRWLVLSAAHCLQHLAGSPGKLLPLHVTQARPQEVSKTGDRMSSEPVRQLQGPSAQVTLVLKEGGAGTGAM